VVAGGEGLRVYKTRRFLRLELLPSHSRDKGTVGIRVPGLFVVIDNTRIHVSQISQPQCSRCTSKAHPTAPAAASTYSPPSASLPAPATPRPPSRHCRRPGASSSPGRCCCCCTLQLTACPPREPGLDAPATSRFGHRAGGPYSRPCCPHVQWPGCPTGCPWPGAHSRAAVHHCRGGHRSNSSVSFSLASLQHLLTNDFLLRNIVATVNLACRLDLKTIAMHARNAEYNPKVSPSPCRDA